MRIRLFISVILIIAGFITIQSCKPRQKVPVIGLMMDQFNVERWALDTTYFIDNVKQAGW